MSKRWRDQDAEDNGFAAWGGYMAAKKAKLQEQFSEDATNVSELKSNIFNGVCIFVNGYTIPSSDELKRLMMLHGGIYHHYQTDRTTHIVASNLPQCKMKQVKNTRIVKPEWIVESIKAGRLLDYRQYLLYNTQTTLNIDMLKATKLSETGSTVGSAVSLALNTIASNEKTPEKKQKGAVVHTPPPIKPDERVSNGKEKFSPHRASTKTAAEPSFLSEFYSNSRLHHISTMGAMFKQYVGELREASDGSFSGRAKLQEWKTQYSRRPANLDDGKIIMHIDMDCFFVSVGLRDRPHLKGVPVAVTHAKGNVPSNRKGANRTYEVNHYRQKAGLDAVEDVDEKDSMSEIASCSYEARKCGVKNGMFLGAALKLCPDLKTIPYDFEGYKQVSYCLYDTVAGCTLDIEAVSCDEMFVDCTEVLEETSTAPLDFAEFLRLQIKDKTGCTASVGFGANRLQARLATKKAKPDGQFYLQQNAVPTYMLDIKVEDLPGVGRSLAGRLHAMGVVTCSDLKSHSLSELQKEFGSKTGTALYKHSRGEDDRPLKFRHVRKSVSAEVNYGIRFTQQTDYEAFLRQLADEVATRLKGIKSRGRCITLKLMVRAKEAPVETAKFMGHGVCDQITKSTTLNFLTGEASVIAKEVLAIARQQSLNPCDLRGIGIQVSRLEKITGTHCGTLDGFFKHPTSSKASLEEHVTGSVPSETPSEVCMSHEMPEKSLETHKLCKEAQTCKSSEDQRHKPVSGNPPAPKPQKQNKLKEASESNHTNDEISDPPVSLYTSMTEREVRTLVREWVACEEIPQACDVDMLADYLEKQAASRNIEALDMIVRCLCRCVNKKRSEKWNNAQNIILNRVQNMMKIIYGATLKITDY